MHLPRQTNMDITLPLLWSPLPSAHHLTWCYSYCPYCHSCVLESSFGLPVLRHHSLWLTWSSNSTLAKWCSSLALGTQQTEFSEGPIEMQCVILPNFSLHKETMILSSISMAILNVNHLKRQALSAPISLLHTIQPLGYTLSSTLSSLDPPRTIEIELHRSKIVEH